MNKILKFIQSKVDHNQFKQQKVIDISNKIAELIQIRPESIDREFSYTIKKYKIVKTTRAFNPWVDLFEIIPVEYDDSVGFVNTKNPKWIEVGGTTTINLPPDNIVNEFFVELEKHIKE